MSRPLVCPGARSSPAWRGHRRSAFRLPTSVFPSDSSLAFPGPGEGPAREIRGGRSGFVSFPPFGKKQVRGIPAVRIHTGLPIRREEGVFDLASRRRSDRRNRLPQFPAARPGIETIDLRREKLLAGQQFIRASHIETPAVGHPLRWLFSRGKPSDLLRIALLRRIEIPIAIRGASTDVPPV